MILTVLKLMSEVLTRLGVLYIVGPCELFTSLLVVVRKGVV